MKTSPGAPALAGPSSVAGRPFRLTRWFSLLMAVGIFAMALVNAWAVSRFLNDELFQREGAVSRDFVQNVLLSDGSVAYFEPGADDAVRERFKGSVLHLSNMRDVLRANVYRADGVLLWSSDPSLVGRHFEDNDELEEALRGDLVVHAGRIGADERDKAEHTGLPAAASFYVETYIPILNGQRHVVGAVELYKVPVALTEAIERGRQRVAVVALGGALALFLVLYGLVRRADLVMRRQHAQLLESETMAVIGEVAASVAHNIRNPLASIRSAAELIQLAPQAHAAESSQDILSAVDRVADRIHDLLRLSSLRGGESQRVPLGSLLQDCAQECGLAFARRGQQLTLGDMPSQAAVLADAQLLKPMVLSLLSNAGEAMGEGGEARIELDSPRAGWWQLRILDRGSGLPEGHEAEVLRPFFTTKPQGLGLGLPLARRVVERLGGQLRLDRREGGGTVVRIDMPGA